MQNLREAIFGYRSSIHRQVDEKKREAALSAFVEYLERYYFLICFTVFLSTDAFARPTSPVNGKQWDGKEGGFQMWMKARPELYSVLRRLLRRDPMGALGLGTKPRVRRSTVGSTNRADMDAVVSARSGEVLGRSTILKSDHFPGCQNVHLPEKIEGAPNFRQVAGLPVFGVGNPTLDGVRAVLQRVNDGGRRPVLWQNMREEPVVYINGKPFVLREVERPFKNMLEYTGIERERVEQMEARLKEDVLREAERYDGAVMVNHETETGEVYDVWEQVTPATVHTPLEVYTELQAEGFLVEYARVPITDGKAPKSPDFDAMARNIVEAGKSAALVFNCQMGRGRTTTGTVIGSLVHLRIAFGRPLRMPPMPQGSIEYHDEGSDSGDELADDFGALLIQPQTPKGSKKTPPGKAPIPTPRRVLSGNFYAMEDIGVIRKIARLLENGAECRALVDQVVDRCDAMQNLREAILHYRRSFNNQGEVRVRRAALNRGIEYLERYFMLIIFAGFLESDDFSPEAGGVFKTWVQRRPEIRQMKMGMRLRPARIFTAASDSGWRGAEAATAIEDGNQFPTEGEAAMEATVRSRVGSVLGRQTILKLYHFPGQRRTPITEELGIHGAPNLCKVEALPVYSLATPTVEGIKGVLNHIDVAPGGTKRAVLTDLREEVVVYVNGLPFVLRELEQHIQSMHYVGIEGPVVEQMEARLKDDIEAEAKKNHGRVLLHREEAKSNVSDVNIVGYWEDVRHGSVKTPAEVYAALKEGGHNIDYARIPLTRERFPKASDVDLIQSRMNGVDASVQFMFISHTGIGGVAYAMAITCLRLQVEAELHGFPKPPPPAPTQPVSPLVPPSRNSLERVVSAQSIISGRIPSYRSGEIPSWRSGDLSKVSPEEQALRAGDYRDILSLVRVLQYGPESKAEADEVIDRCAVAGRLKDDIYYHKLMLDAYPSKRENVDERRVSLTEDGLKALRRYFYLVAFCSYLRTCNLQDGRPSAKTPSFSAWVEARPELGHLLSNLKLQ